MTLPDLCFQVRTLLQRMERIAGDGDGGAAAEEVGVVTQSGRRAVNSGDGPWLLLNAEWWVLNDTEWTRAESRPLRC